MPYSYKIFSQFFTFLFCTGLLIGCSGGIVEPILDEDERELAENGKLFGEDAFTFGDSTPSERSSSNGIGVNGFLWRASLDTLSFLPLLQADPFGGVIITDWYTPPETPNTRFKMNIFILGRQLRADGLRISIFKEEQNSAGIWSSQQVDEETILSIENAILERAREIRISSNIQN